MDDYIKNTESIEEALETLAKDSSKITIVFDDLVKLTGLSRRTLYKDRYIWCISRFKELKESKKKQSKEKDKETNILKFDSLENRLKEQVENLKKQNTQLFYDLYELKESLSKIERQNQSLSKERDEYKAKLINLKAEKIKELNDYDSNIISLEPIQFN